MREAWAFKAGVFYGPCSTFREAWSVLESTPGPDGYVLGPTSPDFCRRWMRDDEGEVALTDGRTKVGRVFWEDVRVWDPTAPTWSLVFGGEGGPRREPGPPGANVVSIQGYRSWLREQAREGVRVLYVGPTYNQRDYSKLADRIAYNLEKTITAWPSHDDVYTVAATEEGVKRGSSTAGVFYYLPRNPVFRKPKDDEDDDDVQWNGAQRKRRVAFSFYSDEVYPLDFLSWRVLEHLVQDRRQRQHYAQTFPLISRFLKLAKATAAQERPFVDLVLSRAGLDPRDPAAEPERARCERLLRWWKIKVKEHRTLGTDEAKALRMIEAAFKRGDDHENDPEYQFLRAR